jgi:hypothetical protein
MNTASENPKVILPLLAIALASQLFLFNITYTNASFAGQQFYVRDYLAPSQIISANFDRQLTIIADNLVWSVSTAIAVAQPQITAFFGLNNYKYGQNRYTSLESNVSLNTPPQVLGAYQPISDYQFGP